MSAARNHEGRAGDERSLSSLVASPIVSFPRPVATNPVVSIGAKLVPADVSHVADAVVGLALVR